MTSGSRIVAVVAGGLSAALAVGDGRAEDVAAPVQVQVQFQVQAVPAAVAEETVIVHDPGDDAGEPAWFQAEIQLQDEPAAPRPEAAQRKLEPLPPAPLLLEQVMRGLLEAAPGRETLDDAMRRAAARNEAAAEAAQRRQFVRQQAQQFEQMLQPLLAVELTLVQRTCGTLPPEARRDILAAARQGVRDVAERVARMQFEGFGPDGEGFDVRRAIHDRVVAAVEPRAARDEYAAYDLESQRRQDRRAEAARMRIVAKLDDRLGLSAAQRRAVLEDLRARWQASWVRELEDHDGVMINDLPPAPDFADACIAPHLDPVQRRQWKQWNEAAGWKAVPRAPVDWSELNTLQQGQQKIDAWWRP